MPNSVDENEEREQQLDALIAEYYRLEETGKAPDHNEFIAQHPDFAKELTEFFADVLMLNGQDCPDPQDPALEPTIAAGTTHRKNLAAGAVVRYFGVYEILEELGAGGMGVVYKAQHARLRKLVALKMIRAGELATEFEVKMFQAEARAAAKLDHPGIVAVHEVGLHAGQHFYSMDYVAGGSLSKLHRDEPVAARRAAELVRQMAVAIHYAHGQGIVHRDLKPANVLLTTDGVPRITDFGLAKRLWAGDDSMALSMTETGQILGTAGYMSPEQAGGKTKLVGPPADIYALGAVLYALLTSRAPFIGESQADTIRQVIEKEPVSPRVLNPSLPRDLETICLKCLNKERHERYGTAKLLANDLERFLEGRPVLARPISSTARVWRWCRRNVVTSSLIATSAIFLLVVVVLITVGYVTQSRHAQQLEAESSRTKQSLYFVGVQFALQEVRNGDFKTARDLLDQAPEEYRHWEWHWLSRLCDGYSTVLTESGVTVPLLCPTYSPDGRLLAVVESESYLDPDRWGQREPELRLLNAESGKEMSHYRGVALAYAPDSRSVAISSCDGVINVIDVASGERKRTYQLRPSAPYGSGNADQATLVAPCFSPDGRFLAAYESFSKITLWRLDSQQVYLQISLPLDDLQWGFRERGSWLYGGIRPRQFFSPDGTSLAFPSASDPTTVSLWNLDECSVTRELKGHMAPVLSLQYSPDGSRLASVDKSGVARIWDPATGETVFETKGFFRFSRDGKSLVAQQFVSEENDLEGATFGLCVRQTSDGAILWKSDLDALSAEFAREDSLLAVVNGSRSLHVLDARRGTELLAIPPLQKEAGFRLEGVLDGGRVAAINNKTVDVLDLSRLVLGKSFWEYSDYTFSSDGRFVWSVRYEYDSREIAAWNFSTGQQVLESKVTGHLISPDGLELAGSHKDSTEIWSLDSSQLKSDEGIRPMHSLAAKGNPIAFSTVRERLISEEVTQSKKVGNGGGLFSSGSSSIVPTDKKVSVWSFGQQTALLTFELRSSRGTNAGPAFFIRPPAGPELASNILGVVCSDNAHYLATLCGNDVQIWDCDTAHRTAVLKNAAAVSRAVFAPRGTSIATTCQPSAGPSEVRLWSAGRGKLLHHFIHTGTIQQLQFVDNGEQLLCCSPEQLQLWSVSDGKLLLSSGGTNLGTAAMAPDGKQVLSMRTGGANHCLIAVTDGKTVELPGSARCEVFTFSPDSRRLMTMDSGVLNEKPELRMFDTATGTEVFRWSLLGRPQFTPDGSQILMGNVLLDSQMKSSRERPGGRVLSPEIR